MQRSKAHRLLSRGSRDTKLARLIVSALAVTGVVCTAAVSWAAGVPNHVRDVRVHAADGDTAGAVIEVQGTSAPSFSVRVGDGGKRLLVDISDSDMVGAPDSIGAITTRTGPVGGVLTQTFKTEAGNFTRLSVNLSHEATYRVRAEGNVLKITLSPGASTVPLLDNPPTAAEKAKVTPPIDLREVKFEREPPTAGKPQSDSIVIKLSALPAYSQRTTASGRLRLEIKNAQVPESLTRTLDVTGYKGSLSAVSTFYDADNKTAVIEVERANGSDAEGQLTVDGNSLVWSFAVPRSMATNGAGRGTKTVARERDFSDIPRVEQGFGGTMPTAISSADAAANARDASGGAGDDGRAHVVARNGDDGEITVETSDGSAAGFTAHVNAQIAPGEGRFPGRRVDVDLKDVDIHNLLRLLADVGRVNIITADDVQGSITIRMRNVPWDQALEVVLQSKSLGMVRNGNLIRVAPLATLQRERELRIAAAKQEYELQPLETRLIPISYATADELQSRAKDMLSPRGSMAVDERTNILIARDIAGNLDHIEELVRSLDTQTAQVLVEARIVEATSSYTRDIGIQWGGDAAASAATGNATGLAFPSSVTLAGGATDANTPKAGLSPVSSTSPTNPNFAVNLPATVGTGSGGALGLSLGSIDNNFNLAVRLSAAETEGLVRIVSSPRILTLNNREARINQGTLIPFSQVSAQGVQTTFQEAKLQLLVRPHVSADGAVAMHVKVNRDEPDFAQVGANGAPTILKREAETDLLVMDGHTAVIGGIFTRNTGRSLAQVPFFGDIPIIGILFQHRSANDTRNELVIFLTPRIVNRGEALGR
jgi:type IV pilus assembly protein PilQ